MAEHGIINITAMAALVVLPVVGRAVPRMGPLAALLLQAPMAPEAVAVAGISMCTHWGAMIRITILCPEQRAAAALSRAGYTWHKEELWNTALWKTA